MTYGTANVDTIQSSTANTPVQFKDGNGTQVGTLCRAWVNFNGTGTVAIRASFNVSSITDNGTGNYTVNFTNAMSDTNYSAVLTTCRESAETDFRGACIDLNGTYGTTSFRMATIFNGSTVNDRSVVTASVFR